MLSIIGTKIFLTRGDTAYLEVQVVNEVDSADYEMQAEDTLILTVRAKAKTDASDRNFAFQKEVKGSNVFIINPEDTENLTCSRFLYDVELHTAVGEVFTIIQGSAFELLKEVT